MTNLNKSAIIYNNNRWLKLRKQSLQTSLPEFIAFFLGEKSGLTLNGGIKIQESPRGFVIENNNPNSVGKNEIRSIKEAKVIIPDQSAETKNIPPQKVLMTFFKDFLSFKIKHAGKHFSLRQEFNGSLELEELTEDGYPTYNHFTIDKLGNISIKRSLPPIAFYNYLNNPTGVFQLTTSIRQDVNSTIK